MDAVFVELQARKVRRDVQLFLLVDLLTESRWLFNTNESVRLILALPFLIFLHLSMLLCPLLGFLVVRIPHSEQLPRLLTKDKIRFVQISSFGFDDRTNFQSSFCLFVDKMRG